MTTQKKCDTCGVTEQEILSTFQQRHFWSVIKGNVIHLDICQPCMNAFSRFRRLEAEGIFQKIEKLETENKNLWEKINDATRTLLSVKP